MPIQAPGIRTLALQLGTIPAETRAVLRPVIRAAATSVTAQAKQNASWSSRIPGAISVGTSFTSRSGGVAIRVSSTRAPHARAYEGATHRPTFRHPVFGTDTWVTQQTRPFLFPAVRSKRAEVVAAIGAAVRTVTRL